MYQYRNVSIHPYQHGASCPHVFMYIVPVLIPAFYYFTLSHLPSLPIICSLCTLSLFIFEFEDVLVHFAPHVLSALEFLCAWAIKLDCCNGWPDEMPFVAVQLQCNNNKDNKNGTNKNDGIPAIELNIQITKNLVSAHIILPSWHHSEVTLTTITNDSMRHKDTVRHLHEESLCRFESRMISVGRTL